MKKVLIFLFLIVLSLPFVYALTASIGNAKVILRVNASPEDPAIIERTILVNNKNEIPVNIILTPSNGFDKFVDIKDKEFVLQPSESKKALFILTIDRGGRIEGNINVGFSPADPTIKENNVGLSSNIIILSEGPIIEEPEEEDLDEEDADEEDTVPIEPYEDIEEPIVEKEAKETVEKDGPSPLIGVLIIIGIIAVGLGLFFGLRFILK